MEKPKYKIGDTVVLKRRWFLWFKDCVLCEIVGGVFYEEWYAGETRHNEWRYTLKIGNGFKRFCMWENELI